MGVYKAAVVTESGQNLIAQAFTSEKKLIFTSAKTSSYSYPAGTNISALTGLQDVVQSVIPSGTKTIGGNVAQVTVRFDNDSIDQAYLIQTIGLYAKIEDGEETLFSVTQAMVPDEMPVHSEVSPSAYIYNIQSTVQNASQITITVNPTGAASVQDFLDIQNPTFDDSGTSEEISSFPEFLDTVKSKMNFFQFFRNLKSGLQFVLHVGSIVNNCVTDNPNLPLSAAQGKALQDQLATLNSNLFPNNGRIPDGTDFNSLLTVGKYFVISNDETQTMTNIPEKMAGRLFVLNMLGDDKVLNKGYQYFIQIYLLYTGTLWTRSLTREADDSPIVFNNWVKRW